MLMIGLSKKASILICKKISLTLTINRRQFSGKISYFKT
jgi:hypothetical protein